MYEYFLCDTNGVVHIQEEDVAMAPFTRCEQPSSYGRTPPTHLHELKIVAGPATCLWCMAR